MFEPARAARVLCQSVKRHAVPSRATKLSHGHRIGFLGLLHVGQNVSHLLSPVAIHWKALKQKFKNLYSLLQKTRNERPFLVGRPAS